jgi:hypothetical protein
VMHQNYFRSASSSELRSRQYMVCKLYKCTGD